MATTYRASDYQWWDLSFSNFLDFGEYADEITRVNERDLDLGPDDLCTGWPSEGEWFYIDYATRTIYSGFFCMDNGGDLESTTATFYDKDEEQEYRDAIAKWMACPKELPAQTS